MHVPARAAARPEVMNAGLKTQLKNGTVKLWHSRLLETETATHPSIGWIAWEATSRAIQEQGMNPENPTTVMCT